MTTITEPQLWERLARGLDGCRGLLDGPMYPSDRACIFDAVDTPSNPNWWSARGIVLTGHRSGTLWLLCGQILKARHGQGFSRQFPVGNHPGADLILTAVETAADIVQNRNNQ